jgi:hypothetical protein
MIEPKIQIGDHVLTEAQAIAMRVAVTDLFSHLQDVDFSTSLGAIGPLYCERLGEILSIIHTQAR